MFENPTVAITRLALLSLVAILGCRGVFDRPAQQSPTQEYEPHQESVDNIVFSPDGKYLATSHTSLWSSGTHVSLGGDPAAFVKLWDAEEAANVSTFRLDKVRYGSLQFTPDSKNVVALCGPELFYWDLSEQSLTKSHFGNVETVSPNAALIAQFGTDGRLDIIDTAEGAILWTIETGIKNFSAMFSPDSSLVAVAGAPPDEPFGVTIWNCKTHEIVCQSIIEEVGGSNYCWSFSPDGRLLAAVSINDNRIRLLETRSGKLKTWPGEHSGQIRCLAFSPDGRTIASGGEGAESNQAELIFWDVEQGKKIATHIDHTTWGITALAFSPDGKRIVTGDGDGKINAWEVEAILSKK